MFAGNQTSGRPIGYQERAFLVLIAAALLAGFALARALEPDPRGYGTHQRLGLPECTIRTVFGRPCPGCGMTTSFAHFVRGEFRDSVRSNPAGCWMAACCALVTVWCFTSAACGRLIGIDDPLPVLAGLVMSWGGVSLLVWLMRVWA